MIATMVIRSSYTGLTSFPRLREPDDNRVKTCRLLSSTNAAHLFYQNDTGLSIPPGTDSPVSL